jgi:hypothetical protein
VSPDEFRFGIFGIASLRFQGDDRFVLDGGDGDPVEYQRQQPWRPEQPELASFAGRYSSDETQASYRVTPEGDGLVWTPEDRPGAARSLKPLYADTFEPATSDLFRVVRFFRDSAGSVSGFEMADSRVHALRATRTFEDSRPHRNPGGDQP